MVINTNTNDLMKWAFFFFSFFLHALMVTENRFRFLYFNLNLLFMAIMKSVQFCFWLESTSRKVELILKKSLHPSITVYVVFAHHVSLY